MNRKYLYALLATPFLLAIIGLLVLPSSTREMFLYEFKHALMGYDPEDVKGADGSSGLRIEHPEEYGPQGGEEALSEATPDEEQDEEEHVDGETATTE